MIADATRVSEARISAAGSRSSARTRSDIRSITPSSAEGPSAVSRSAKRYSSRTGSSARRSTTYTPPSLRTDAWSNARAFVRRPMSRASGSSIRSTSVFPISFSTSNILLRVSTRSLRDCSSDVMSSPERPSS